MELIKICKSAPLKVNCFPECAGIYHTCDAGKGNQCEKGHGWNEDAGPGRVFISRWSGETAGRRSSGEFPVIFPLGAVHPDVRKCRLHNGATYPEAAAVIWPSLKPRNSVSLGF